MTGSARPFLQINSLSPFFLGAMGALLALPLLLPNELGGPFINRFAVYGGDEPHYLVLLHSVIEDFDFDLRNNYEQVHDGRNVAGRRGAHLPLDHHVTYYLGNERKTWSELFEPNVFAWPIGADGRRIPVVRRGVDPAIAALPEYPAHPVGLALILAPFLFPFRGTELVEPAALVLATISVILAMVLFYALAKQLAKNANTTRIATAAAFLGTPVWFYTRTVFTEPFLVLAVIATFFFAWRQKVVATSAFLAAAVLMKPQLALIGLPLLFLFRDLDFRVWIKRGAILASLPAAAIVVLLILNQKLYGSWARGPYPFYWGNFFDGAKGLLVDPHHGLLPAAPILAVGLLGWGFLFREDRLRRATLLVGFSLVFAFTSFWQHWDGGYCYGPRLLIPIVPLAALGLIPLVESRGARSWLWRAPILCIVLLSVALNYTAVKNYYRAIGATPGQILSSLVPR